MVSTVAGSPANVALSGTGVTPMLGATPTSLSFANVTVGSSSNQTLTLTNAVTGSVTVSQAAVTGAGFSISGLSLPAHLPVSKPDGRDSCNSTTVATGSICFGLGI